MAKDKEAAQADFITMICRSWTWERLTKSEQCAFESVLLNFPVKGNYDARWYQLQMAYAAFLAGCGYRNGRFREPEKSDAPLF